MATHIVQIGKTRFICGLFWQSLSRPRDFWKEAVVLANKIDADMLVLRKDHAMAQAGYVHSREGARRGQQSLAAVISKTIALEGAYYDGQQQPAHNWLCAMALPDGMWAYCAVRDANFLPNGDFAGTREEVLERLQGDYALGGWNVVIGEPELEQYGFHNFSGKTLLELIPVRKDGQPHVRRWSALRPTKNTIDRKTALAIIGGSLIVLSAGAWYAHQLRIKQEQERERAFELARQRLSANNAARPVTQPWLAKPLPLDLARACVNRLDTLTPGGWQLEKFQCDERGATYSWTRNGSNVSYLLEKIPTAQIALSGDAATSTQPFTVPAKGKDTLVAADGVIRTLLTRYQSLGLTLKLKANPDPAPPPSPVPAMPGTKPVPPPPPEWKTWAVSADLASLTPVTAAELLNQPGVRLDKISWRSGLWSIEGVMYAK